MWSYEHSAEGDVEAAAVWSCWSDVATWGEWNGDIEAIEIDGPFLVGARISMKTGDGEEIALRLATVEEDRRFVDEAELDGIVVRTEHLVEPVPGGRVRITYRTEIDGPGADEIGPEIGPGITGDFPEVIAALIARAGRG